MSQTYHDVQGVFLAATIPALGVTVMALVFLLILAKRKQLLFQ